MMKSKRLLLLSLLSLLFGGCSIQQVLHSYPEDAMEKLSPCEDCLVFDIESDGSTYTMREAAGNLRTSFIYTPGNVNVEKSGTFKQIERLNISQTDELDYAGHQYRLEARYTSQMMQTETALINILRIGAETTLIGDISLSDRQERMPGRINQQTLYYREKQSWDEKSEKRTQAGEAVWHQYPAGYLSVIEDNKGMLAEVLEGAQITQLMGLDGYSGAQYRLQMKDHLNETEQENIIVFTLAAMLAEQFNATIELVHDCLEMNKNDRLANNCPSL